jgi:hypothetical protein
MGKPLTPAQSVVRRIANEMRRQREVYEARIKPYTGLDFRKKITTRDVVRELAVYIHAHDWATEGDGSAVPVPGELLNLVGERLVGQRAWQRAQNEARRDIARRKYANWQTAANEIWVHHGDWSAASVAAQVAKQFAGTNPDTIRRKIVKPR